MAGHSKWANIQHRKGKADKAKSKVFSKLSKEITVAAKAGTEDGNELFGHSIIVNPQGEIIAMAASWDDELITADCDLDMCALGRTTIFALGITSPFGSVIAPCSVAVD